MNGYRGALDHAPGGSPNNYALFAFDFAKCLPGAVTSQGQCSLNNGWAETVGSNVYSPVSGTIAWTDAPCAGLAIALDGAPGYRIVLFHLANYPTSGHLNQGDPLGTISNTACIGQGNHIHMALYYCDAACQQSDTAPSTGPAARIGIPFAGQNQQFAIGGCVYPDLGANTSQDYLGSLIPCTSSPVTSPPPTPTSVSTGLLSSEPQGITVATDGTLWYADAAANLIGHYMPATGSFDFFNIPTPASLPTGIVFDERGGNVWFTESSTGNLGEIPDSAAPGSLAVEYATPSGFAAVPTGVSIDSSGDIWFAENGVNQLGELTPLLGGFVNVNEYSLPFDCSGPEGAVVDPAGDIWTSCEDSNSLADLTPFGQQLNYPVSSFPEQLAVDQVGNIWFTEWPSGLVGVLAPGFAVPESASTSDPGLLELSVPNAFYATPSGVWIDALGNVWYTDAGNQTVGEFVVSTGAFATYPVPQQISTYPEGNEGNGLTIDLSGNAWFAGYVGSSGYLGELPGAVIPVFTSENTIANGGVSSGLVPNSVEGVTAIPAGVDVSLANGVPFSGTFSAPLPVTTTFPPPPQPGQEIVQGSTFGVGALSTSGAPVHVIFSQPVTVSFPVNLAPGESPLAAQVWYFDEGTQQWLEAGTDAGDPGGTVFGGIATVQTTHLTVFAVTVAHNVYLPAVFGLIRTSAFQFALSAR